MDEQEARKTVQTLVKHAQMNAGKELSKPSKPAELVVANWLSIYTEMYPAQELTPELVLAYREGLSDLPADRLHEAFRLAMRKSQSGQRGFRPTVGEVGVIAEQIETAPVASLVDPECCLCSGTGWKPSNPQDVHSPHIACECRIKKAV